MQRRLGQAEAEVSVQEVGGRLADRRARTLMTRNSVTSGTLFNICGR